MGERRAGGAPIPPLSEPREESTSLEIGERIAWGNLFSIAAVYQRQDLPAGRYFDMYMGDATRAHESEFTRDLGIHAFLPDLEGRPQGLVVNVYLDDVHTQLFIGTAVWEEGRPNIQEVLTAEAYEHRSENALNFLEAAEEATKIILRTEARVYDSEAAVEKVIDEADTSELTTDSARKPMLLN